MTTRNYNIVITVDPNNASRNANSVRQSLLGVETQANSMQTALRRAFAFVGVAAAVREVARLGEAYQQAQNRLKTVTSSTEELTAVQDALFNVAQRTRQEFNSTVETYARVRGATQQLGLSQQQTIDFIERVNKAIVLSGSTTAEATGAMRQFTQALGSGTLRGEELNSVLEQTPVIADVIAKQLGVTRGQLKKLAQEGKITTDEIIKAFNNADSILSRFDKTTATVGQSWIQLTNAVQKYVGEADNALGISAALSRALGFLANNVDTVSRVLLALGITLGIVFAPFLLGILATALTAVLNPITLIVAGFAALVAFSDRIVILRDGFTTLKDVVLELFRETQSAVPGWTDTITDAFTRLFESIKKSTEEAGGATALWQASLRLLGILMDAAVNLSGRFFNGLMDALSGLPTAFTNAFKSAMTAALEALKEGLNRATEAINDFLAKFNAPEVPLPFNRPLRGSIFEDNPKNLGQKFMEGFAEGIDSTAASDAIQRALDRATQTAKDRAFQNFRAGERSGFDLTKPGERTYKADPTKQQERRLALQQQVNRELAKEYELLRLNKDQQEIVNQLYAIQEKFIRNKTPLNDAELAAIKKRLEELQALKKVMQTVEDAATAVFTNMENALVEFVKTGKFSFKELADAIVADLIRIALRAFVTNQLISAITGWAGGMLPAGATNPLPAGHAQSRFATGGSFTIPGAGGTDSRMVAFRATPGERVTVTRPDQGNGRGDGGRGGNTYVNVMAPPGTKTETKERTVGGDNFVDVILSTVDKGISEGKFEGSLGGTYGLRRGVRRR